MISISKNKKLNYLLELDIKILNQIKVTSKNMKIILYYIKYSKYLHDAINQRIKLVSNYYKSLNKKCYYYDFYNEYLFSGNILEIHIYLKFQKYYLEIIQNQWIIFNPIINNLISKYLN